MIKLLQADNFFHTDDVIKLFNVVNSVSFQEAEYGKEIPNFNFVIPGLNPIFSRLLGEDVEVDGQQVERVHGSRTTRTSCSNRASEAAASVRSGPCPRS